MIFRVLGSIFQVFSKMMLNWNLANFFLWPNWSYGLGRKNTEIKWHFHHHIKDYILLIWLGLLLLMLLVIHLVEVVFVRLLPYWFIVLQTLVHTIFCGRITIQPTVKGWRVTLYPPPWGWKYLQKLFGIGMYERLMSCFPSIYLFRHLYLLELMDICFIL